MELIVNLAPVPVFVIVLLPMLAVVRPTISPETYPDPLLAKVAPVTLPSASIVIFAVPPVPFPLIEKSGTPLTVPAGLLPVTALYPIPPSSTSIPAAAAPKFSTKPLTVDPVAP